MIVKWKPVRLNVIPVPEKTKTGAKTLSGGNTITLKPGYNEVANEIWEAVEPMLENHIKNKNIELIDKKISDLQESEIAEILAGTDFPETITAWMEKEDRESIRIIMRNRLDEINHYIKTGKKKGEE